MDRREREITREQYERAVADHNGYLADEDLPDVFTESELCGYGIYSPHVAERNGKYVVLYYMGKSCD